MHIQQKIVKKYKKPSPFLQVLIISLALIIPFTLHAEDKNAYTNTRASLVKNLKKSFNGKTVLVDVNLKLGNDKTQRCICRAICNKIVVKTGEFSFEMNISQ